MFLYVLYDVMLSKATTLNKNTCLVVFLMGFSEIVVRHKSKTVIEMEEEY